MKIIGLITGWGCEDFIIPSIEQAIEYCDEVLVCIAPHTEEMKEFEDKTSSMIAGYKFNRKVKIIYHSEVSTHAQAKATILNKMLSSADNFVVGNWLWILDIDEFYFKEDVENIKVLLPVSGKVDQFGVEEKYFMFNMQHYLTGTHNRLFRINNLNNMFFPTQRWSGTKVSAILYAPEVEMYHYGMLTNPHAKIAFWRTEYPDKIQTRKTLWLDKIYRNYDLNDEDYWVNKNYELTGTYSPWFAGSFKPNDYGKLFKYEGIHPKFIEETKLPKIKDFRKYFNFKRNV